MKKLISLLLVLAMALTLAACGSSAPAATEAPKAEAEAPAAPAAPEVTTYKIGVAYYSYNDNFLTLYRNEMENYIKSLETDTVKYELTVVDGKDEMATQSAQIDTFITQEMDLIMLNLVQTSSADAMIDKIVDAGIPLVIFNREPLGDNGDESYERIINNPNVCYVGADARQSGTMQGNIVLAQDNKGDMDGDGVVRYVMIMGQLENPDAQYRTEFSIKALTDAGVEVEELDKQLGNWQTDQAQTIAANALAQHGDKIDIIFCNNDSMAVGAYESIKAAGRTVGEDILLLGVDALVECQEMVLNGTMTGTVLNDHIGQSHACVDAAITALTGGQMQNYYWVDYVMVDQAYVQENGIIG